MVGTNDELVSLFPHLFQEVTWPWGPTRARFILNDELPPSELIANVNIVPKIGSRWLILQLADGSYEVPGGTLEPGENFMDAILRELREEAGATLVSSRTLGAWACFSLSEFPFRPHLPHPNFYRLVLTGEIAIGNAPSNPAGAEKVVKVELLKLSTSIERFVSQGRQDLAELYQLASKAHP